MSLLSYRRISLSKFIGLAEVLWSFSIAANNWILLLYIYLYAYIYIYVYIYICAYEETWERAAER